MRSKQYLASFSAILAALLFGISSPISKILLEEIPPTLLAALLYLGAGLGMALLAAISHIKSQQGTQRKEAPLSRNELPFIFGMILLDMLAPISLMAGLLLTTAANASLLNNFEIVATTLIALLLFHEAISKRLWIALGFITIASLLLSFEDMSSFSFSTGSFFVILACICWGFENNMTRKLSIKNPMQIVIIKGFGSGFGSLLVAFLLQERTDHLSYIIAALLLGFVSYGLSIFFYVTAQRELGASRTSAFYALAPFIGVGISFLVLRETPTIAFFIALPVMAIGIFFTLSERHKHAHLHPTLEHEHRHNHMDGHHIHSHPDFTGEHSHVHSHEECVHTHKHTPDIHHTHEHPSRKHNKHERHAH
ncbi:MAG: protein of unknown function transrane [Herbinix sp.]|jgi:drug/metabolite transporter (DMT)-like permease|nr:protein of unknown function transrane [Herbinix sp.]